MSLIQTETQVLGAFNRELNLGTGQSGWPHLTNNKRPKFCFKFHLSNLVSLFEFPLQPWPCHRVFSFGKKFYSRSSLFTWMYKMARVICIFLGGGGALHWISSPMDL